MPPGMSFIQGMIVSFISWFVPKSPVHMTTPFAPLYCVTVPSGSWQTTPTTRPPSFASCWATVPKCTSTPTSWQ